MDIRQLKFLIALDETQHFGQAAERCNISQPALSMRLRSLEEELNLTLVKRGKRFEGFTESGQRILAWARTLLAAHDGLQAEAANCRGQFAGSLRLGIVPLSSFDPTVLLKPLSVKYPGLYFRILSMSSEHIIDALARNQLDVGVCYLEQVDPAQFEIIELERTGMGLLHDRRHFHFDEAEISWDSLCAIPLGLLSKGMHYRQSIDLNFRSRNLVPQISTESDSTAQLVQMVSAGICCAVMPLNGGIESLGEHLVITPIADAVTIAPVGLLIRKTEPVSVVAEMCFAEARALFGAGGHV